MIQDICYIFDDNCAIQAGISINSLLKHNKDLDLKIHILDDGISEGNKNKLISVLDKHRTEYCFYKVNSKSLSIADSMSKSYNKIVYTRLFLCDYIKTDEPLIYFDSDTFFSGSIAELCNYEFSDNIIIAGVVDRLTQTHTKRMQLPKGYSYINAGVILINTQNWQEARTTQQLLNCYAKKPYGFWRLNEQDLINYMLYDRIDSSLPYTYNGMPKNPYSYMFLHPKKPTYTILHYTGVFYKSMDKRLLNLLFENEAELPWTRHDIEDTRNKSRKCKDFIILICHIVPCMKYTLTLYGKIKTCLAVLPF